jgi:hypothetical protein
MIMAQNLLLYAKSWKDMQYAPNVTKFSFTNFCKITLTKGQNARI